MPKEKGLEKLSANWLRKGGVALTALAATVFFSIILHIALRGDIHSPVDAIPDMAMYVGMAVIALCAAAVFCYQFLCILTDKIILSRDGIEIKRFFKRIRIPQEDIIRIDGVHERVMGAASQNRTVIKIVTTAKTYEVTSHEFFGLKRAITSWVQDHKNENQNGERVD